MVDITFKFTKIQKKIILDQSRNKVIIAGRRVGKTYVVLRDLVIRALSQPNQTIWYLAVTYDQAERVAWDELLKIVPQELIKSSHAVRLRLKFFNNSQIQLFGVSKYDNLRGNALNYCVFDEFAYMNQKVYEVIQPMLATTGGGCTFISTPNSVGNAWDRELYEFAKKEENTEWSAYHFTSIDGGLIKASEIESARAILSEKQFKVEYEASFDFVEGIIYSSFSDDNIKDVKDDGDSVLHIGMDFNVDPMTAVIGIKQNGELHIIDEITLKDSNTNEMCEEIRNRYKNRGIIVYPDPSGKARKTSAFFNTDFSIISSYGYRLVSPTHAPAVSDRINEVNAMLRNAKGENRLFINPKCTNLIKSLKYFTYKENTKIPDKSKNIEHWSDALGYMIHQLFPIVHLPNTNNFRVHTGRSLY